MIKKKKSPKLLWIGVLLAVIGLGYTGWVFYQGFASHLQSTELIVSSKTVQKIRQVESWLNPLLGMITNGIGVLAAIGGLVLVILNIEKASHDLQEDRRKCDVPVKNDRRKRG